MADDKLIRVGIAGLGRSGWSIHASTLKTLEDKFKVAAVFDKNTERLKEAEELFGCAVYTEIEDLLKDDSFTLFINALPSFLHADKTIEALQAGIKFIINFKHVVQLK